MLSPGQQLPPGVRLDTKARFAHDFSRIRVHADRAAQMSSSGGNYVGGLEVGAVDDPLELEADRVATHVLRTPDPVVGGISTTSYKPRIARQAQPDVPDVTLRPEPLVAGVMGYSNLDGFAFDGSTLTAVQRRQIAELAPTLSYLLRAYPRGYVWLTGHTDAVGTEAYNDALGTLRAEAVRDALIDAGVPASGILIRSAGASELAVRSRGAEPRNRRVESHFTTSGPTFGLGTLQAPDVRPTEPTPTPTPTPTPGGPPAEAADNESRVRLTLQVTPQRPFRIAGARQPLDCGDTVAFPVGLMVNWDGISLADGRLNLIGQPELDWDVVQAMCGHPANLVVQDNLVKWTAIKDVLELALVGQVNLVEDKPVTIQPGLQLSWHPLTQRGGNKELQLIFGPSLNWAPGAGTLDFVIAGGLRFELPH